MGNCDSGRCCTGAACETKQKCCCKGTFHAGEVCRTVGCNVNGGCDYRSACECENSGGSLTQSCDPCLTAVCDPTQCQRCVSGACVSYCTQCQDCVGGVCRPKCDSVTCGRCQYCNCGTCVTTGIECGFGCCSFSQCCVGGACVSCDCTGQIKPGPCYVCQSGFYVNPCTSSQKCCDGTCATCCNNGDCGENEKCVAGQCEPKQCSDYKAMVTHYQCPGPTGGCCCDYLGPFDRVFDPPTGCPPGCVSTGGAVYGPGLSWPPPWGTPVLANNCGPNSLP